MNFGAPAKGLALGSALALVGAASASASIVYAVDQVIGNGSVMGSITTNGALGALLASDFTNWNLTLSLSSPSETFVLTKGNSVVFEQGADVAATATQILFNFSGADNGILLFQDGLFSGQHYWCNATQLGACFQGKSVVPIDVFTAYANVGASGVQVIAGVPESSTWALMFVGFAALAYGAYRQTAKARLAA
jgi:hypothetical protein